MSTISFSSMASESFQAFKVDLERNSGNIKSIMILLSYRIANVASRHRKISKLSNIYAIPVIVMHRFLTEWIFGMEIPAATQIGKGLIIDHGYALVVNKNVTIGNYCRLRHCTTIGCKLNTDGSQGRSPKIGDHVDIGANASIIGDIFIGENTIIGAGCVVVKNMPSNSIAVGNPAKIIKIFKVQ